MLLIQEELIIYNSMDISSAHLNVGFWVADDSVHTAERERKEDLCSQVTRPSVCMHACISKPCHLVSKEAKFKHSSLGLSTTLDFYNLF